MLTVYKTCPDCGALDLAESRWIGVNTGDDQGEAGTYLWCEHCAELTGFGEQKHYTDRTLLEAMDARSDLYKRLGTDPSEQHPHYLNRVDNFRVSLGPRETALVIRGGNWDAEGCGELVSALHPFCVDTSAEPVDQDCLDQGYLIAVHTEPNKTLYVQNRNGELNHVDD